MASTLYLCSVNEIDSTYEHVLDFNSTTSRRSFFNKKIIKEISVDFKGDEFRHELSVPAGIDSIVKADYLFFTGDDRKDYFYFIESKEYMNSDVTKLYLSLDVFTTYQFDYEFMHSFVERCHVDRFTSAGLPSYEVVDEGFNYTNYIEVSKTEICEYQNSFIMTSSEPLGYIPKASGGGGSTTTNGIITKQGFRFIKGYEAFTPEGLYLSGEDFRTVGYGSTEKYNQSYYDLHKPFPCTEQRASEIYAERIVNEFGNRILAACEEAGVKNKIKQNMFDAMCSLAYNRGINGFLNDSTSPFQAIKLDPTNLTTIRKTWEAYATTSNGTPLAGLVARRKAEANIYCLAEYEMRSIGIYKNDGTGKGVLSGTVTDNDGNGYIPPHLPDLNQGDGDITDEHGNTWTLPTAGKITEGYPDYSDGSFHGGIDFANSQGTPIYASGSGTVAVMDVYQGNKADQPYGNLIIINQKGNKTGDTYKVYYAHLNEFASNLKEGDTVIAGQLIGHMGTTGNSTGNHLHYEMRQTPYSPQSKTTINPAVNLSPGMTV